MGWWLSGEISVSLSQPLVIKSKLEPNDQLEDEFIMINTNAFNCDRLLM